MESRIVGHDLMATDVPAAEEFYAKLFGWKAADGSLEHEGATVARVVAFDAGLGVPSHWVHYVSVDDVDAACDAASELGGACCYPRFAEPGLGAFAMLADAGKALTKPLVEEKPSKPRKKPLPGFFVWEELASGEAAAAESFYGGLYGWAFEDGVFGAGGRGIASLGEPLEGPTANAWVSFVLVESLAKSLSKGKKLGAKLIRKSLVAGVKGAILEDPTGARFGLIEGVPDVAVTKRAPTRKRVAPKKKARLSSPQKASSKKKVTATATPRELFARLPERFDAKAARGVSGVVQYEITGELGGSWFVTFEDGTVSVDEGVHEKPTVTLSLSAEDYADIAFGRSTGIAKAQAGKMRVGGDVGFTRHLGRVLRPLSS